MFLFLINLFLFSSGLYIIWVSESKEQRIRGLIILIAGSIGCFLSMYAMGVEKACQTLSNLIVLK